jgi:predicted 2-oxoglutarate/Fe(II)-dependent dioxygenase YbiX
MPRIVLPLTAGGIFDSWHQADAGRTQIYWLDIASARSAAEALAVTLTACEAEMRAVTTVPPDLQDRGPPALIDRSGDLARAVGTTGPAAVVVDAAGRLAAVASRPTPEDVAAIVARLHAESEACVVRAQAPVLLIERAADPELCASLIEHWHKGDKLADGVASASGASTADAECKRRHDVPVDEKRLFTSLRDGLVRRVLPSILRAFQTRIVQIELPRVGCYDARSGGWFRPHRDNTTPFTAHRQFALSLNLNATHEYEGGEVRFPEFGRQLYRPPPGGALVFSCSLLHETMPVRHGRRFGLFTFLHDESRDAQYRGMMAEQKARGLNGIRMRLAALLLPVSQFCELAEIAVTIV